MKAAARRVVSAALMPCETWKAGSEKLFEKPHISYINLYQFISIDLYHLNKSFTIITDITGYNIDFMRQNVVVDVRYYTVRGAL